MSDVIASVLALDSTEVNQIIRLPTSIQAIAKATYDVIASVLALDSTEAGYTPNTYFARMYSSILSTKIYTNFARSTRSGISFEKSSFYKDIFPDTHAKPKESLC